MKERLVSKITKELIINEFIKARGIIPRRDFTKYIANKYGIDVLKAKTLIAKWCKVENLPDNEGYEKHAVTKVKIDPKQILMDGIIYKVTAYEEHPGGLKRAIAYYRNKRNEWITLKDNKKREKLIRKAMGE